LSSREEQTGRFRAEPEVASASGGHLTPDVGGDSIFDPLNEPLPSEIARRADPGEQTEALPRSSMEEPRMRRTPEVTRSAARGRAPRRKGTYRRVKRTVKHIDPISVLKLSLFFYACFVIVWLILVAIVYSIVNSMGVFDAVETFGKDLVLWKEVNITLGLVERWALLIGVVLALVASLINVVLAFLYNVGADILGGLDITFVEKDA
jgi:hypothetical protein